jgi:hypothetical protein
MYRSHSSNLYQSISTKVSSRLSYHPSHSFFFPLLLLDFLYSLVSVPRASAAVLSPPSSCVDQMRVLGFLTSQHEMAVAADRRLFQCLGRLNCPRRRGRGMWAAGWRGKSSWLGMFCPSTELSATGASEVIPFGLICSLAAKKPISVGW